MRATIFDGEPMVSLAINQGASLTYYYKLTGREGTYLYHCHVEATEHMQMGMLGNLYVRAAKIRAWLRTDLSITILTTPHGLTSSSRSRSSPWTRGFMTRTRTSSHCPLLPCSTPTPSSTAEDIRTPSIPNFLPVPQQKIDERAVRGFPILRSDNAFLAKTSLVDYCDAGAKDPDPALERCHGRPLHHLSRRTSHADRR